MSDLPQFAAAQNARSCAPCGCAVAIDSEGRIHIERACSLPHRLWIVQKISDAGRLYA